MKLLQPVSIMQKVKYLPRQIYGISSARAEAGFKEDFHANNLIILKYKKQNVMKKQATSLLYQMSAKNLASLTTVVNETLATGIYAPKLKTFTAADLWNIQRQGKSRAHRRLIF